MAALVAIFLAALLLSLGFAFAAPWLVLVPIAIVIVFVVWVGSLLVARRTPQEAVRRTRRPQLLGPGGPDDPEA
jgi:NADH:ubiquinone oxidoreductase subunit 6 (subunit J)